MKIMLDECEGLIPNADHTDVLVAAACKIMNMGEVKIQFIIHPSVKPLIREIDGVKIYTRRKVHPGSFVSWSRNDKKKWNGRYGLFDELIKQITEKL